ncbi:hypothetical protein J4859_11460 [Atopobium sp. oral taxon 416]|nr:hypothetical protein J4859_11460 [Atopobium sp. oral taxon 416]
MLFTSCYPGWIRYAKAHHPEIVDRISTAKSPPPDVWVRR